MIKNVFISGGCNSLYNAMDFCQFEPNTHLIAYPCSNQVLVYDIQQVKILYSYSVFNKRVNCVRFLNANTLIAVDGQGSIAIFDDKQLFYQIQGNGESIQIIKIIEQYIIALSIDGIVSIYDLQLNQISKLEFGHNVMETLDAIKFNETIFVALSGVDTQIHLYILENQQLHYLTSQKGHQRSLNSLSFQIKNENVLYLASASKDTYVRIWSIYQVNEIEPKVKHFNLNKQLYSFKLESILQGHVEEVSSICWSNEQTIISGSFDYNAIIWKVDQDTQLWLSSSRLGQTSGNKNQIFGVLLSKDKQIIVCYTLTGAIFIWKFEQNNWIEQSTITGHYAEVTDLDFQNYLVTCSLDQTSRIFSKWNKNNTYHEISRPQIHGYDLNAIKQLQNSLISGGDEKILRLFAPSPFTINQLNYLSDMNINEQIFYPKNIPYQEIEYQGKRFKEFKVSNEGIQQALGLMNVQMQYEDDEGENFKNEVEIHLEIKYGIPPNDALLVNKSLWPETNKFYGHGYAIQAIACYNDLVASSCLANTDKAAEIILWDSNTYRIKQTLQCHNLTVVQLAFSKSGNYLISVSKDRSLGVFKHQEDNTFKLLSKSEKCQRIIYTCSFSYDEKYIFTGSRDKNFRVYETNNAIKPICIINLEHEITAIDSIQLNSKQLIAIGFQNGQLKIYTYQFEQQQLILYENVDVYHQHSKTINKLQFNNNLLASCSDDHTVRIFEL